MQTCNFINFLNKNRPSPAACWAAKILVHTNKLFPQRQQFTVNLDLVFQVLLQKECETASLAVVRKVSPNDPAEYVCVGL